MAGRSRGVARYFSRRPGVSISRIRRLFASNDEIHVEFEFAGESFQVWEPYGDNSRYRVGPTEDPQRRRPSIEMEKVTDEEFLAGGGAE